MHNGIDKGKTMTVEAINTTETRSNKYTVVEYNGTKTTNWALNLINAVKEYNPSLVIKVPVPDRNRSYHYLPDDLKGGSLAFDIFEQGDLKKPIGRIGSALGCEEYFMTSPNQNIGRWSYDAQGYVRTSKHMKNILKFVKQSVKPLTMEQAMTEQLKVFKSELRQFTYKAKASVDGVGNHLLEPFLVEIKNMQARGYIAQTQEFAQFANRLLAEEERIFKYGNYDPQFWCVWVRTDGVLYRDWYEPDENIMRLNNRTELPEDIQGRMALLDVIDSDGNFQEDIGMKSDNSIYWILK